MIEHHGETAFRLNPANLIATGESEMIGMKLIPKRGVMIAVAVIAVMTLTAGVAAAASMKAKKIEAEGFVTGLDIPVGTTIQSKFKIHKPTGAIKSVSIKTFGEDITGAGFAMTACEPDGGDACALASTLLSGGSVHSVHTSKAKLTVIATTPLGAGIDGLVGFLKGSLKSELDFTTFSGDVLSGKAKLKIKSPDGIPSVYACVSPGGLVDVSVCAATKGKTVYGVDPVMLPLDLHVVDTGTFSVKNSSTKLKGDLQVFVGGGVIGPTILITDAKAKFTIDDDD